LDSQTVLTTYSYVHSRAIAGMIAIGTLCDEELRIVNSKLSLA